MDDTPFNPGYIIFGVIVVAAVALLVMTGMRKKTKTPPGNINTPPNNLPPKPDDIPPAT